MQYSNEVFGGGYSNEVVRTWFTEVEVAVTCPDGNEQYIYLDLPCN